MEIKKENLIENKSSLSLDNRKKLQITGVVEVISFNDKDIQLDTKLGKLMIKGEKLKMNKLDVQLGDVAIIGQINSLVYTSIESKNEKESIIARLFR